MMQHGHPLDAWCAIVPYCFDNLLEQLYLRTPLQRPTPRAFVNRLFRASTLTREVFLFCFVFFVLMVILCG